MMNKYPGECFRGIPNENGYIEEGCPKYDLFVKFDNTNRVDGNNELSITWNDGDEALKVILNQMSNEKIQFKYGVAVIKRSKLDNLKKNPQFLGILDYERRPTANNPYHGNILLKNTASKSKKRMVACALAVCAEKVIRNNELETSMDKSQIKNTKSNESYV